MESYYYNETILLIGTIVIILVVLMFIFDASYQNSPNFCMSSHELQFMFHEPNIAASNLRAIFSFTEYENELFWKHCY